MRVGGYVAGVEVSLTGAVQLDETFLVFDDGETDRVGH
jgi:hypothetical protein